MNVILPESLNDLFDALEEPGARLFAGGTDFFARERIAPAGNSGPLIGLERIAALRGVTRTADGTRIGALTTFANVIASSLVRDHARVLALAAATVGGPAIREMATLGGNIVTASPAGDSLPALAVLNAEVEVISRRAVRRSSIADFVVAPRRTTLARGEILAAVLIPDASAFDVHHFEKVGRRDALSIAVVGLAALLRFDARGRMAEARLAWGSAAPVVRRCPEAEAVLLGRKPTRAALARAGEIARGLLTPIDDIRASAGYRREVAGNLPLRLVV